MLTAIQLVHREYIAYLKNKARLLVLAGMVLASVVYAFLRNHL